MPPNFAHRNHYVPQWYQRLFLLGGATRFHYLDLSPETITSAGGKRYQRRALLRWGPANCFRQEDLYTLKLGHWGTDQVERFFFGPIDARGEKAVTFFSNFRMCDSVHDAYQDLMIYMDAQRLRTPRGLDWLVSRVDILNRNLVLMFLGRVFQLHQTMWTEGVWEIVHARNSATKFLLTDGPVTFYNAKAFPGSPDCTYPNDVDLSHVGTRTIFPLGAEACLIVTHIQLVRDPWAAPRKSRINARSYSPTIMALLDVQFGRELEEDEVLRINLILKRRATRYIAALDEAWLYPERHLSTTHWSKLDDDWFLFPHLYKVPFTGGIVVGYKDGTSFAVDEYGRRPGHPQYQDKAQHDREWIQHRKAQLAWAIKREGKATARVDEFKGNVGDAVMADELVEYRAGRLRHLERR